MHLFSLLVLDPQAVSAHHRGVGVIQPPRRVGISVCNQASPLLPCVVVVVPIRPLPSATLHARTLLERGRLRPCCLALAARFSCAAVCTSNGSAFLLLGGLLLLLLLPPLRPGAHWRVLPHGYGWDWRPHAVAVYASATSKGIPPVCP